MKRTAIGTGLICLDAIHLPKQSTHWLAAGGTSLNILAHLKAETWSIHLYGHIGTDRPANQILNDLNTAGFPTKGIQHSESIHTPVYVQATTESGHVFLRECPRCNTPFPRVAPMGQAFLDQQIASLPELINVAIIERAHDSAIQLAEVAKQRGALIYVELNRIDPELDHPERLLPLADVFKCSHDRLHYFETSPSRSSIPVEIITLGDKGVRYRIGQAWNEQPSLSAEPFVDAAGAGDAFSATLLDHITQNKQKDIYALDWNKTIQQAQRAAADNCTFTGPRGGLVPHNQRIFGDDFCIACARV